MRPTRQTNYPADNDGPPADPVQAAADDGIDVAQLRDNLALSVAERLRRHQLALDTVELLQQAQRP